MLSEDLAECLPVIVDRLVVQEVQLLKHVYEIYLFLWRLILFYYLAVFLIELLYLNGLALFLLDLRQVHGLGAEEAVAVWGSRDAALGAEERDIGEATEGHS